MKKILSLLSVLLLSGCTSAIDGARYQQVQPAFDLVNYFDGEVKAWGIVQDRSGNILQRFRVDIAGRAEPDGIVLDETFHYEVGEGVEKRIWRISSRGEHRWQGSADDIVGEAAGEEFGNALQWTYQMDLQTENGTFRVNFDDWMWRFGDDTLMNRSYIRKFGIVFAEVTIFMQKQTVQ